jgi:hypothetical protein
MQMNRQQETPSARCSLPYVGSDVSARGGRRGTINAAKARLFASDVVFNDTHRKVIYGETPIHYFLQNLTPDDAYFVRWHYAGLPTRVDLRSFRTEVIRAVDQPLQLLFDDLRTKFERAKKRHLARPIHEE